jgi:hypothetical protein
MPIDPITWAIIIGGALAGFTVDNFWDEIKEWASRMLGYILDVINHDVEVTSDALVYIVKEGTRIYKEIEVFSRNIYTGATTRHVKREEISPNQVPPDIEEQLEAKRKVQIMQQQT